MIIANSVKKETYIPLQPLTSSNQFNQQEPPKEPNSIDHVTIHPRARGIHTRTFFEVVCQYLMIDDRSK